MMFKRIILSLLFFSYALFFQAQGKFRLLDTGKKSESVSFSLVNNMVVIDAEVNGKKLTFLLDTGIRKTLLFNLKFEDSLVLRNVKKMKLRGLGEGNPINAMTSNGNYFKFENIVNPYLSLYAITDDLFDLSAKMGQDIHGIIGGDLFRNFVVKINYGTEKLTFYDPQYYDGVDCKGCETFPLDFYNGKPFIDVIVENHLGKEFPVKLLIDSGGGDSLWQINHGKR